MPKETLDKVNKLLELVQNDTITPKQIEQFLSLVLQHTLKSKKDLEELSTQKINEIYNAIDIIENKLFENKDIQINVSKDIQEQNARIELAINTIEDKLKSVINGTDGINGIDGKDGMDGKDGIDGKDGSPDTGEQIVQKINELPLEEDLKIDASHIKNLPNQNGFGGTKLLSGLQDVDLTNLTINADGRYVLGGGSAQDIVLAVKEAGIETLAKGVPVYASGANGANLLIKKASALNEATSSKTLGITSQAFAINGQGTIITEGFLSGIDTSMAVAGDPVWLSPTAGELLYGIANKPQAPIHLVFIGIVTRAQQNNGEIYVKIQNGFEIEELHDVQIINKTDGDIIKYDSATNLWKNSPDLSIINAIIFG